MRPPPFGYELVSVEQTKWGKLFELEVGGGGGGGVEGKSSPIPLQLSMMGKPCDLLSHEGKDFSVIAFCSVNCQLAYSRKERVPDSLLLLLFVFGCFRVWHQEISSSSFLRISKDITTRPTTQMPI
jgi:hypothetical protein